MSNGYKITNNLYLHMDDAQLWQEYKAGRQAALLFIYDQHYQALYRYGYKICTDKNAVKDCIQDIFTQLWLNHQTINDVHHIRAYLLKYLRRQLFKSIKNDNRFVELESLSLKHTEIEFSYEALLIEKQISIELKENLNVAMEQLSKRQQEAIYLRFYHDLSYEQIAEIMALKYQSVRNLVHESIKVLREHITVAFSLLLVLFIRLF